MGSERRKAPRQPAVRWSDADRDLLRKIHARLEAPHAVFLGQMTPEQHIEHHAYLEGWKSFWDGLKAIALGGLGDGFKQIVKIITVIVGALTLLAMFGSILSPEMRGWLSKLLLGG